MMLGIRVVAGSGNADVHDGVEALLVGADPENVRDDSPRRSAAAGIGFQLIVTFDLFHQRLQGGDFLWILLCQVLRFA